MGAKTHHKAEGRSYNSPSNGPTLSHSSGVRTAERTMTYGIVAGLVVSQANLALFDDLIHRQASFEGVGWGNWFLFVLVPVLAGGLLLYYGRVNPEGGERKPERAFAASLLALLVATVVLRLAVPAILHAGDVLPGRLPRTLADGFSFVAEYGRLAPLAGQGHGYDVATAAFAAAVMAAAIALRGLGLRTPARADLGQRGRGRDVGPRGVVRARRRRRADHRLAVARGRPRLPRPRPRPLEPKLDAIGVASRPLLRRECAGWRLGR